MILCRLVDLLLGVLPLSRFQDILLRSHVRNCPRCKSRLVSRKEAGFYLSSETDFGSDPGFNKTIREKAALRPAFERPRQSRSRSTVRWAAAAAGLMLISTAVLWFSGNMREKRIEYEDQPPEKFRINRLIVEGTPADALVIHPRESDMVIIWIERHFGSPDRNGEQGGQL
jgi:hypothetical protein